MKFNQKTPPRFFKPGNDDSIQIADCGQIFLEPNDQVTFLTQTGKEYDFTAKSWGFYATPSINSRLRDQEFKTALVKNSYDKYYIMVVEKEKMDNFESYLKGEGNIIIEWLDER